jgi:molybdate transport system ATP-binding protein
MLCDFGIPVVLVTHDRMEAIALGDRVVVMDGGQIEQSGSVEEVFSKPANSLVARIVGIETVTVGAVIDVVDGLAIVDVQGVRLMAIAPATPDRSVHVCIKGEDVILQRGGFGAQSSRNHLPGSVTRITPEGPLVRVGIDCGFQLTALVTRRAKEELRLKVGDCITASIKAPSVHLMPLADGSSR